FDLIQNKVKIPTKLRQDFTCFTIHYFFNNLQASHYDFLNDLRQRALKIYSSKTIISSTIQDFDDFFYKENYSYFFDSVATAKTIIKNANKLNLNGNLSNYTIAEEESSLGKKLKQNPFSKIKSTERDYYTDENKLSTADIYICNTSSQEFKNLSKVFSRKTLTHEQYRSFVNSAYNSGYLIPISLKKLETTDVSGDFTSSKVKVLNFISDSEDIQDNFLKKVIELLSIKNKATFIKEMDKVIDIKNHSISLNPYGTRTTFNFDLILKDDNTREDCLVFIQGNQFYIKPPETTSDAGLGGISMEYLKKNILNKLPDKGRFNRSISNARKKAFGNFYKNTQDLTMRVYGSIKQKTKTELEQLVVKYKILSKTEATKKSVKDLIQLVEDCRTFKKYKKYNLLSVAKILSPSEFSLIFDGVPESLRTPIASSYLTELYSQLNNAPNVDMTLSGQFKSKTFGKEQLIMNKLSDIEILFFLASNYSIVKKWIKNSFIMGAYGIGSGTGIILLDGKKHTLGRGKAGILRRNPVFVKIGV
ncbi:MAG: hypothetical protein EBS55_10445, partial [Flavobacteriaceae bacterium]|nr:hypothetical protein [Flavobacteriaceae bacterium]